MADLVTVQSGEVPWLPSPGSRLVEVYDRYDVPTAGVVQQDGVDFLFRCVGEGHSGVSLWAYVLVTAGERAKLENGSSEDFATRMDSALRARSGVLAIALEGLGIVANTEVHDWAEDAAEERRRLIKLFEQVLDGFQEDAENLLV